MNDDKFVMRARWKYLVTLEEVRFCNWALVSKEWPCCESAERETSKKRGKFHLDKATGGTHEISVICENKVKDKTGGINRKCKVRGCKIL